MYCDNIKLNIINERIFVAYNIKSTYLCFVLFTHTSNPVNIFSRTDTNEDFLF